MNLKQVAIFSLEMTGPQIIDKLNAMIAEVSLRSMAEGLKTDYEIGKIGKSLQILNHAKLVVRTDVHDLHGIMSVCRALAASKDGLSIVLVDYIQLVRCDLGKDASREREVAEVSRSLRLLGLELGCLVIAITQLNEQGKARESRAIQMDATCVMAVKLTEDPSEREIVIPYQRNGPCGVQATLQFIGKIAKFKDKYYDTDERKPAPIAKKERMGGFKKALL